MPPLQERHPVPFRDQSHDGRWGHPRHEAVDEVRRHPNRCGAIDREADGIEVVVREVELFDVEVEVGRGNDEFAAGDPGENAPFVPLVVPDVPD
eukprot:5731502-Heterocapsa_arctica.AAC.1